MSAEAPRAILFDLGGVLTDVSTREAGFSDLAAKVRTMLERAGHEAPPLGTVEADLREGAAAYGSWKRVEGRRAHPREATAEEFWDLVTLDWPPGPRSLVAAHAVPLARDFELLTLDRPVKPGVEGLLEELSARGIRLGVVCNCLSGEASRQVLSEGGILERFQVLAFSGDLGRRKPGTEIVTLALSALDCAPAGAWMLGDTYDRDILAARRAGLARCLLVTSALTSRGGAHQVEADAVMSSPLELLGLL